MEESEDEATIVIQAAKATENASKLKKVTFDITSVAEAKANAHTAHKRFKVAAEARMRVRGPLFDENAGEDGEVYTRANEGETQLKKPVPRGSAETFTAGGEPRKGPYARPILSVIPQNVTPTFSAHDR